MGRNPLTQQYLNNIRREPMGRGMGAGQKWLVFTGTGLIFWVVSPVLFFLYAAFMAVLITFAVTASVLRFTGRMARKLVGK